jgi:Fur family transcriptional regulator, ferric uptake regulator
MTINSEKLNKRHIKPTAMRELVLKVLTKQNSAISLSELELKFEKADRTTLYRTLKTFEENKLIHSIDDGTGSIKYALCLDSCMCNPDELHVHFKCIKCHQTFCLNEIAVPQVSLPSGFELESINMVVKGVCSNCKK